MVTEYIPIGTATYDVPTGRLRIYVKDKWASWGSGVLQQEVRVVSAHSSTLEWRDVPTFIEGGEDGRG